MVQDRDAEIQGLVGRVEEGLCRFGGVGERETERMNMNLSLQSPAEDKPLLLSKWTGRRRGSRNREVASHGQQRVNCRHPRTSEESLSVA